MPDSATPHSLSILVLACAPPAASRAARFLRECGHAVTSVADADAAVAACQRQAFEVIVAERDEADGQALAFLARARAHAAGTPRILVTPSSVEVLAAAVNDAAVSRVVRQDEPLTAVNDAVLAVARPPGQERGASMLRERCRMLEEKIDRLVRESVQRDGSARLMHDLLVEVGQASTVKEVATRCVARIVTLLRLDLALLVLVPPSAGEGAELFSFGCPRSLLTQLEELPWGQWALARSGDEHPVRLAELMPALARTLRLEGVPELLVYPLYGHGRALGFFGAARRGAAADPERLEQLKPVVKQVAIAVDNAQLVAAASDARSLADSALTYAPFTVVVLDRQARILRCFDSKQELFRGRAIEGSRLADLLDRQGAAALLGPLDAVARGADSMSLRALRLVLCGQEKLVNADVAPLPRDNVILLLDDATGRESMASNLQRARALTSSLFANAPAAVAFLRHSGEIIDINPTACSLFGRSREALLGESLEKLFPDVWRAAKSTPPGEAAEVTFAVSPDRQALVSLTSTRLGRPGRPAGILLQLQDLREVNVLRQELRRRDNLALMGQMVSFVAHEIKNPLFGISSAAQVLAREIGSDEARRLSGAMLSEIERLGQLLEELLVFGSKRQVQKTLGDPTELCRELAAVHGEALSQRGVELRLELEAPELPLLFDPARLRQVLVNLLSNAMEATPAGGRIALACRANGPLYRIDVANTGSFISAPDRERIFDLFYSTKPRGNGLGLPICRKIVEDHGGRLELESSNEAGTCFSVYLPAG